MTPLFAGWPVHRLEAGYLDGMRATVRIVVPFRYAKVNGWYYNAPPIPTPRLLLTVLGVGRGHAVWFLFNALARVSRNPAAADRAVLAALEQQWRTQLLPRYRRLFAQGDAEVDTATPQRLVEIIDQISRTVGEYLWYLAIVGGSAWKMEQALTAFCRKHLADGPAGPAIHEDPQVLLRGLPGTNPGLPGTPCRPSTGTTPQPVNCPSHPRPDRPAVMNGALASRRPATTPNACAVPPLPDTAGSSTRSTTCSPWSNAMPSSARNRPETSPSAGRCFAAACTALATTSSKPA